MASEAEEKLIKKRMGYNEPMIRGLIQKTNDYINKFGTGLVQ